MAQKIGSILNILLAVLAVIFAVLSAVIIVGFIAHEFTQNRFTHTASNLKFFGLVFGLLAFFSDKARVTMKENVK